VSALVVDVGSSTTRMGYAGEDTPKAVFPSLVGVLHSSSSSARDRDVGRSPAAVGDSMDVESTPNKTSTTSSSSSASSRYFVGTTALAYRRDFMELQSPLADGLGTLAALTRCCVVCGLRARVLVCEKIVLVLTTAAVILTLCTVSDWELYERLLDHGFQKALGVDPKHHPVLLAEPTYNTRQLRERATELLFEKYQVPALFTAKNPVLSTYDLSLSPLPLWC
jgi:actin-like protein 6A